MESMDEIPGQFLHRGRQIKNASGKMDTEKQQQIAQVLFPGGKQNPMDAPGYTLVTASTHTPTQENLALLQHSAATGHQAAHGRYTNRFYKYF
jgi:hypothetical protein